MSIGRVVVPKRLRGSGTGKRLMDFSVQKCYELFEGKDIVISAQTYLRSFYSALGFKPEGEEYLEDDIPHIKMRFTRG
jgi:ElaA protein